jgi:DNA polymerase alpha subunit A
MLLLHEFKKKKFILPDKKNLSAKELKRGIFGEDEEDHDDKPAASGKKGPKRKKAQYSGGLVIEPKAGFYDSIILLLDFNSLYPSIIQEYNLCFTTVNRRPTKNFNGTDIENQYNKSGRKSGVMIDEGEEDPDEEEENEEDTVELPDKNVNTKDAVLPNVLRDLVQKRRAVKDKMKTERDPVKLQQLEIRQKAIKLTANSMYGCLGFSSSRFHAKAIAALITKTGRNTLLNTKEIAE